MAIQRVVIEITGDPKHITDTMTQLEKLGKVDKDNEKQFKDSHEKWKQHLREKKEALRGYEGQVKQMSASFLESMKGALLFGGAAGIGAMFAEGIVDGVKESIKAFMDLQKTENQLGFSVKQVSKETDAQTHALIKQAEEVEKVSTFSHKSVMKAQNALITEYRLSSKQVMELMPTIANMAAAAGEDIESMADKVGKSAQGNFMMLHREFGRTLKDTGDIDKNVKLITKSFADFAGQAENATHTLSGEIEQLKNKEESLQEKTGAWLATWIDDLGDVAEHYKVVLGLESEQEAGMKAGIKDLQEYKEANKEATDAELLAFTNMTAQQKAGHLAAFQDRIDEQKKEVDLFKKKYDDILKQQQTALKMGNKEAINALAPLYVAYWKKHEESNKKLLLMQDTFNQELANSNFKRDEKTGKDIKERNKVEAAKEGKEFSDYYWDARLSGMKAGREKDLTEQEKSYLERRNKLTEEFEANDEIDQENRKKGFITHYADEKKYDEQLQNLADWNGQTIMGINDKYDKEIADKKEQAAIDEANWEYDTLTKMQKDIDNINKKKKEDAKKSLDAELADLKDFVQAAIDLEEERSEAVVKANEFRISQTDSLIQTEQTLAEAGLGKDLAFEEKRRAALEAQNIKEAQKQKKLKELMTLINSIEKFAETDPKTAVPKALGVLALMKGAEAVYSEEGGLIGSNDRKSIVGAWGMSLRHKSGRDVLLHAEEGEMVLPKTAVANLGINAGNYKQFISMLSNPANKSVTLPSLSTEGIERAIEKSLEKIPRVGVNEYKQIVETIIHNGNTTRTVHLF